MQKLGKILASLDPVFSSSSLFPEHASVTLITTHSAPMHLGPHGERQRERGTLLQPLRSCRF